MVRQTERKKRKAGETKRPPLNPVRASDPLLQDVRLARILSCSLHQQGSDGDDATPLLRGMLDLLPDGVILCDQTGTIVQLNALAAGWFGSVSSLFTRPLEQCLAPLLPTDLQGSPLALEGVFFAWLLHEETCVHLNSIEVLFHMPAGSELQLSIAGTRLYDQQHRVSGAILVLRDMTDRYMLEKRLRESERQAQEQTAQLEAVPVDAQGQRYGGVFLMPAVTEHRQIEQDLRGQNRLLLEAKREAQVQAAQLEAILEAVPENLAVYDREGRIIRSNKAGRSFLERFHLTAGAPSSLNERSQHMQAYSMQGEVLLPEASPSRRILQGETITPENAVDVMMRDPQGTILYVSTTGGPLYDAQGDRCGAVFLVQDITERKRVEQELQLQADLINLAHDAIFVVDPEHRIVTWNQGAERLYGWSAEQAHGQLAHLLLETEFPCLLDTLMRQLDHDNRWEGELIHKHRDGSQLVVESRWVMVRDADGQSTALLEINRDITERVRLEYLQKQLHAETVTRRNLLQTILDALPGSVSLVRGSDARLVLANRATTETWGAPWKEGQPLMSFLTANNLQIVTSDETQDFALWQVLQKGEAVLQQQNVIHTLDQHEIPVLVNVVPFNLAQLYPDQRNTEYLEDLEDNRDNRAALVVAQDVSSLKEAERLKDEFISLAAHELRTPLTVLCGYVQILQSYWDRKEQNSERVGAMLKAIERVSHQLVELSKSMLDATRLQAGQLEVSLQALDLVEMVQASSARLQITTRKHQLSVHCTQSPLMISADASRIDQVLTNLIGNAIKYSPNGGRIEMTIWEDTHTAEACFSIQDQGIGIPQQQQARLFERFFRGENARRIGGTGLGLYLSQTLVKMQGGRIWFVSEEGKSSTFYLAFPLLTGEHIEGA